MIITPTIAVLDINENYLTKMDNSINGAIHFFDDTLSRYLTGTASVFEFKVAKVNDDVNHITEGNKLAFVYNQVDYLFNIVTIEEDEHFKSVTCWSGTLELTNEHAEDYSAPTAMSFSQYFNRFDPEQTMVLNINEVSDKVLKLEWTGENDTRLARMLSLATKFDAEIEFVTELNDDYSLKRLVANVYRKHDEKNQGIGQKRLDVKLEYGVNVNTISRSRDVSEIYTAIRATGNEGLNLIDFEYEEYDENGKLLYYSKKGNRNILAPQMRDRYPSNLIKSDDRYIAFNWSYDTDSVATLGGQALAMLKKMCQPKVTYDIEGYFDLNIGDTVNVFDDGYNPPLILEARVSEQQISLTDPARNRTIFSNVIEFESQVSGDLLAKMQSLIDANKKYDYSIVSDNGIVFKNNVGTTALTALVKDGIKTVTDDYTIKWLKNNVEVSTGKTLKINASDISTKAVYRFNAIKNSEVIGGYEVTVSNVDDGKQGANGKDGITRSTTSPSNPVKNMQWLDTSQTPSVQKYFDGSKWEVDDIKVDAGNIKAGEIGDVPIRNGKNFYVDENGNMTAKSGTFEGAIVNSFKDLEGAGEAQYSGATTIEGGILKTVAINTVTKKLTDVTLAPGIYTNKEYASDGQTVTASTELTSGSLILGSDALGYGVLTAQALIETAWVNLNYAPGFSTNEYRQCQYKIQFNVDGTRTIRFRGQVQPNSGRFTNSSTTYPFLGIPVSITPSANVMANLVGDAKEMQTVRAVMIGSNSPTRVGEIQIKIFGGSDYASLDTLSYVIN